MARSRSPNRYKAKEIYLKAEGTIKLKDIAAELGVLDTQIRKWKSTDKWDEELNGTLPKTKRNVTNKNKGTRKEPEQREDTENESDELTEKQRFFCIYYVKNSNATLAAIKAGYSTNNPSEIGYQLLQKTSVRAKINKLKDMKKNAIMITEEDIVERYMRIAFADMTDFAEFGTKTSIQIDEEGNEKEYKQSYVNIKNDSQVDGGIICEVKTSKQGTSIKLEDRQKALDWLTDYFGMNPEHKYRKEHDLKKLQIERERFEHQKKIDESKVW